MTLNATHDPALRSWVASANDGHPDFPVQNLPHGVFKRRGTTEALRGGIAIGDQILDLSAVLSTGVIAPGVRAAAQAASARELNDLMAMGRPAWTALRAEFSRLLRVGAPKAGELANCLVPQADAEYAVPARIGDYTDFFVSYDHMMNMGQLFQPGRAELPQFKWLPIAYHGRASTVEISGTDFQRPWGQVRPPGAVEPCFGPSNGLDYELEIAAWIGPGNRRGEPIGIDEAEDHLFGVCLLNDWSARDVQGWESVPLGPFLSKNFLTTVSPWIVTWEALAPFRCPVRRETADPPVFAHLMPRNSNDSGALDLTIEVQLITAKSRGEAMRLSLSSTRHACWSFAQMLTHHTENGCAMFPGDLIGSGTNSGPSQSEKGCLMELSFAGRQPIELPNGETRAMLQDGDTVILRAWAEAPGSVRIGLGECRGTVLPARTAG